jgi:hypothetical protein
VVGAPAFQLAHAVPLQTMVVMIMMSAGSRRSDHA